jgi:hypothetical protein
MNNGRPPSLYECCLSLCIHFAVCRSGFARAVDWELQLDKGMLNQASLKQ